MKTSLDIIITFLLLLVGNSMVYSQPAFMYNIGMGQGLPSGHVYYTLTDKHGYLWIASENGVVKYNGYNFKTFNITNGIANADVWYLYEDKKGRLWVFSISDQIGYIANDKYVKCHVDDSSPLMYFSSIAEDSTGIWLVTKYNKNYVDFKLYHEKNDTLHFIKNVLSPHNKILITDDCKLLVIDTLGALYSRSNSNDTTATRLCPSWKTVTHPITLFHSYIVSVDDNNKQMAITDLRSCNQRRIDFAAGEYIISAYPYHSSFYAVSNRQVYIFDSTMALVQTLNSNSLGLQNENINCLVHDSLWNTCIGTMHNGIYIQYGVNNYQKITNSPPGIYVGNSEKGYYLWDKATRQLTSVSSSGKHITRTLELKDVIRIIPFSDKRSLLLADAGMYWLDNTTLDAMSFSKTIRYFQGQGGLVDNDRPQGISGMDALFLSPGNLFMITRGTGLIWHRMRNDTIYEKVIDPDRYKGIVYDSVHSRIISYTDYKLLIYYPGQKKTTIVAQTAMIRSGVRKIEKVLADKWGNVFIKTQDKLYLANQQLDNGIELLGNYTLHNAQMFIIDDQLVLAGDLGVLFCHITGKGQIAPPLAYPNIKKINYSYVTDFVPLKNGIILKTDRGAYSIFSPSHTTLTQQAVSKPNAYLFTASYNNTITNIHPFDTIRINQKDERILLDVINPAGMGDLVFEYKTDSSWQRLNANELHLPHLEPGQYTRLSIRGSDDAWRSSPIDIYVYLEPYWWQTRVGRRMILLGSLLLGMLMLAFVIVATRRIVIGKQKKKQQLLELELKAIHARINPHFIFNTLSTGLYFIKTGMPKEAYNHITAFADLLRSYMRSSKNKYITITEEIENLHNYIVLQQARFEDKFDYTIQLDPAMGAQNIPSLLLQPVVENAITHGLFHKETKGYLTISFKKGAAANELVCMVDDDGIGRARSNELRVNSEKIVPSYGNDLINHLLKTFNEYERTKITLEYIDKEHDGGTTVVITIKYPIS